MMKNLMHKTSLLKTMSLILFVGSALITEMCIMPSNIVLASSEEPTTSMYKDASLSAKDKDNVKALLKKVKTTTKEDAKKSYKTTKSYAKSYVPDSVRDQVKDNQKDALKKLENKYNITPDEAKSLSHLSNHDLNKALHAYENLKKSNTVKSAKKAFENLFFD